MAKSSHHALSTERVLKAGAMRLHQQGLGLQKGCLGQVSINAAAAGSAKQPRNVAAYKHSAITMCDRIQQSMLTAHVLQQPEAMAAHVCCDSETTLCTKSALHKGQLQAQPQSVSEDSHKA
jgi:hypothetical protein